MKGNNTTRKSSARKGSTGKASRRQSSNKTTSTSRTSVKNGRERSTNSRTTTKEAPKESIQKIFEELMRDTYWAEKHLTKALPKMSKAANSSELKEAFDNHLRETEKQVTRLEQVFELVGLRAVTHKCEAMEGLVEEGKEIIEKHDSGPARDAALIISAQKVEHYEIAAYGSLRTLANVMGHDEAAQLLEETLDEESNADELLTQIAMSVNQEAYGVYSNKAGSKAAEVEEDDEEEDYDDEVEEADDVEMTDEEAEEEEEEEGVSRKRR